MRLARSLSILAACLVAMSGLAGHPNTAAAQAAEKRIALVVGNAAYAKSPLATAANDAGLIAQTLQAAGFDVSAPAISTATRCARVFATSSTRPKPRGRTRSRWSTWPATACNWRATTISCRSIPRSTAIPTCRSRRCAPGTNPPARLAAAESRHRRAGRGAAAAFRQRTDRKRSGAGRGRTTPADRVQRGARHGAPVEPDPTAPTPSRWPR